MCFRMPFFGWKDEVAASLKMVGDGIIIICSGLSLRPGVDIFVPMPPPDFLDC